MCFLSIRQGQKAMISWGLGLPPEKPVTPGGPVVITGASSFENLINLLLSLSLTDNLKTTSFTLVWFLFIFEPYNLWKQETSCKISFYECQQNIYRCNYCTNNRFFNLYFFRVDIFTFHSIFVPTFLVTF